MSVRSIVSANSWVSLVALTVGLFFLSNRSVSQEVAVLGDYDFSEPGYTLIFHVPSKALPKYALYTQSQETLVLFKRAWVFDTEAVTYPFGCNDGYNIELQKDHESIEVFGVRIRCKAFIARGEYWDLPAGLPLSYMNLDTAIIAERQYKTLETAREALALIRNNPNIIGVNPPEWKKHDGYFHFRYPNPGYSPKSPAVDWNQLTAEVISLIKEEFPEEDFNLELTYHGYGKNYPEVGFKLSGKKSLFSSFKLYPKSDTGWIDFEPKLTLYQKINP